MTVMRQRRENRMDDHSTGIERRGKIPGIFSKVDSTGLGVYWL